MKRLFDPADRTERPKNGVLALAWVAAAAQTTAAAWAWGACLVIGLLAHRWRAQADEPGSAPMALNDGLPACPPARLPARRRADAARLSGGHKPRTAGPLLKTHCDTLTGLVTPEYLSDVAAALTQDLQARGLGLCVLKIELGGLDDVVSLYGRDAGNQVLVQAAKRLRRLARADDIVMRPGDGNAFVMLIGCPAADSAAIAPALKARVIADLQRPFAYRTLSKLRISCRAGSAIWPLHGLTLGEAMHHADEVLASSRARHIETA
jgi:diguanylate cyclase (GGDEF)-like protein